MTPLRRTVRALPALLFAAGLSGCSGGVLAVDVKLQLRTCDPRPENDPTAGVISLRFTVYGDGIDPFQYRTSSKVVDQQATLPDIPAGPNRRIIVEGLAAGDVVLARGDTGPLDFNTTEDGLSVDVFLRRADAFTQVSPGEGATHCTLLAQPRAGHSATVLSDGKVLIAGGFHDADASRFFLDTTEIYDPLSGTVTPGPKMNISRAYHTADKIPGTNFVVLAGGENTLRGEAGGALLGVDIYDEVSRRFQFKRLRVARTRHGSAIPPSGGRLILVGGYNNVGVPLSSTEVFNPQSSEFEDGPVLPTPRGEVGAIGAGNGRVLVVGGWDGAGVVRRVELLAASAAGVYDLVPQGDFSVVLENGRLWPLLAALNDDQIIVTGGFSDKNDGLPQASSTNATDIIDVTARTGQRSPAALLSRRGHGGAVALKDGTILVAGGGNQVGGTLVAERSADIIYPDQTQQSGSVAIRGVAGGLLEGRYLGRHTLLDDGTVLVTGGISYDTSGAATFLRSIEVFQPRYVISRTSPFRP